MLELALWVDRVAEVRVDSKYIGLSTTELVPPLNSMASGTLSVDANVEKTLYGKPNLASFPRSCKSPLESMILN